MAASSPPSRPAPEPFRHDRRGRSPRNVALAALCLALMVAAMAQGAPWWAFLPILLATTGMVWLVVADPRRALLIDDDAVTLIDRGLTIRTPLAEIDHVEIRRQAAGADVTLIRNDGVDIVIPDRCRPSAPALTAALEGAGVAVKTD